MSEESIRCKGKLSFDEYKIYNQYLGKKVYVFTFIWAYIISVVLFSYLFYKEQGIVFVLISSIFLAGAFELSLFITRKRSIKKYFCSTPLAEKEQEYIIGEEEIKLKIEADESVYKWKSVMKVKEYKNIFIVFVSDNKAIIIPSRFFESENDIAGFRVYISKKSGN